jgi:hypothetical protein
VGRLTLNRNPSDFHCNIEQAAFKPNNLVLLIGPSPDKMLLVGFWNFDCDMIDSEAMIKRLFHLSDERIVIFRALLYQVGGERNLCCAHAPDM